jgi:hypothetical protein
MKKFAALCVGVCFLLTSAPVSLAEPRRVMQGTQIHLTLLNGISTSVARDGDPFAAVVADPVYLGGQLLIPAGARISGVIGTVNRARRFSIFRGQAYLNLTFRSIEIDRREIPVQMSIITLEQPHGQSNGKERKDVRVIEGQVVESKRDIKKDVTAGAIGTGGGTLVGAVFSHVVRGFGMGLAGSAAYIVARKGKEVELPAQTGMLVRLDNTITVPSTVASGEPYNSSRP